MIAVSLLKLAGYASAATISGLSLSAPLNDSFYNAPSNLDSLQNGEVYDSRTVTSNIEIAITFAKVEQLAYKTINSQNESSHSVVTVYTPFKPTTDAKILSYQVYEDSANLNCAPSYSLAKGLLAPDGFTVSTDVAISIDVGLYKGWYVVVPDHEGARSGFIAGHEEAYAGLDAIKAAISHLGLAQDTPTALLGYSGGASATVWMSSLHETHAPELNLVGAAHGGTPVDLATTIQHLDNADNLFSGFIVAAMGGLINAYPDLYTTAWPHFYQNLKNAITTVWEPSFCMVDALLEFMHQDWQAMSDIDFYTFPPIVEVFDYESLLKNVSSVTVPVPKFPRYIWHADTDQIIPSQPVRQYVSEQCDEGANIQYVPWKGDDHVSAEYLGLPDALQFVIQALEFRTPNVTCGTANDDILTLASTTLLDVFGQVIADALDALSVITTPLGNITLDITDGYQP